MWLVRLNGRWGTESSGGGIEGCLPGVVAPGLFGSVWGPDGPRHPHIAHSAGASGGRCDLLDSFVIRPKLISASLPN